MGEERREMLRRQATLINKLSTLAKELAALKLERPKKVGTRLLTVKVLLWFFIQLYCRFDPCFLLPFTIDYRKLTVIISSQRLSINNRLLNV